MRQQPRKLERAYRAALLSAFAAGALAFGGCGEKAEPAVNGSLRELEARAFVAAKDASLVAERCDWLAGQRPSNDVADETIRSTFVDTKSGDVRLLLERSAVRPGAILSIAVVNDSADPVRYGTFAYVEDPATGREVEIDGPYGYRAIGLGALPGEVGPCVPVVVPSDTSPERYRVVLDGINASRQGGTTLEAEFEVRGEPIPNPSWEQRLDQASG